MNYIIGANWKCYIESEEEARKLLNFLKKKNKKEKRVKLIVFPPFLYLHFAKEIKGLSFGAQDVFYENSGAFTGEITPLMLKRIGISFVIIGHSERRRIFGETDEIVNKKVRASLKNNLNPLVCVGETLEERKKGKTFGVIKKQIEKSLKGVTKKEIKKNQVIIAYEPVWAIGGKNVCATKDIETMSLFIRKTLFHLFGSSSEKISVLYGGSVDAGNIEDILQKGRVDGVLVGSSSIKKKEISRIIEVAGKIEGI